MYKPYQPPPRLELPARADMIESLKHGLLLGAAILVLLLPPDGSAWRNASFFIPSSSGLHAPAQAPTGTPKQADFKGQAASGDARQIANWAASSNDNAGMSFVILDKRDARLFVFNARGGLLGTTAVLLGAAAGDDSVAGIGDRPISEVRPEERTTPAGRFIAEPGRNTLGEDVVWVDYGAAVSMHRVRALEPSERRLERLASPTSADNRISYGCINVPVRFYEDVLRTTFQGKRGIVYVLPEVKSLREVFGTQ